MADKDLNSIIDQLITALKAAAGDKYTSPTKSPSVKLPTEQGEVSKRVSELDLKDLNKYIAEQENLSKKILENIDVAEKNAKETIDSEQIINELKEERIAQIKQEFRQNQLVLLELRKQYDLIKHTNSEEAINLKAKIDALDRQIKKQAELLEKDKKQKELKEGILSIAKQTYEMAKQYGSELEKHIIAISKANGGYAELSSNLREAGRLSQAATLGTGITGPENMKALEALSEGFIGLTTYSAQSISSMQIATAQLTKVGVSSTIAAKGFDTLVVAMGKTPEQAGKIQESFVQMAAKNRLALSAVSQAFAENSSRFVGYGEQMTKVLDGLAEQSLKTGIAIGKLVGIAQGFDTFEDASRKVGNLNALLGGDYFNSIELLTASDEERVQILKDGVKASGLQWESMNRQQKQAIATAAGISDLNEAAKLFGQTSLQNTKQQAEQAEVQKTLAEQAESVSLGMDKLRSTLNGLFIALDPIIEGFRIVVSFFTGIVGLAGKIGGPVGAAFASIAIFVGMLAIKNRVLGGSWNFIANSIAKATARLAAWKAANTAGGGMEGITRFKMGPSPSAASAAANPAGATSGFLANAGNMLRAAGAILLFAAALFVLAKALQEFSSDKINKEGIGLAVGSIVGLIGLSFLLQSATPAITSGVFAIALIAGSLLLLGLALQMFSKVDWKLVAGIGVIIMGLGLAIVGLGMVFTNPITAAALATGMAIIQAIAVVIGILALALTAVVLAISLASPAITNLANSFKALFEIKDLKENFSNLESFLSQLSNIDVEPINNLANAIYNLATNLEALAAIPSRMGINVKGTADLKSVVNQSVASAAEATNVISKATSAAATQTLIPAQQTTAFVPLIVQIDKKTIIEILDVEGIAQGVALDTLNKVGIVQSGLRVQDIIPQTTSP